MKKRFVALLLLVLASTPFVANAATVEYTLGGKVGILTTSYTAKVVRPYYQTQTQHSKGISTSIGISSSDSKSVSISTGHNVTLDACFTKFQASLDVQRSATQTITTSQSWTIGSDVASGLYRIEAVFPSRRLEYKEYDKETFSLLYRNIFEKTPKRSASYKRIYRYSDIS